MTTQRFLHTEKRLHNIP